MARIDRAPGFLEPDKAIFYIPGVGSVLMCEQVFTLLENDTLKYKKKRKLAIDFYLNKYYIWSVIRKRHIHKRIKSNNEKSNVL